MTVDRISRQTPHDVSMVARLDITGEVCPMTFVRVKLTLERLAPGSELEVRLDPGEPLVNVPRAVVDHGHKLLGQAPVDPDRPNGPWLLRIMVG